MNSPAIRFAGFAEDWEERKLGDVAEFNPKAVLPNTFEYVDLESVVGTELIGHRTESRATAPSRAQRLAQRGDVFYQTVRPYQKNNYIFTLPYCDYVFSTGYAQMRPSISSSFLFSRLQGDSFVKTVLDRCTGTSYPAINATDLSEVKIMMPDDEVEQAKIGATFCKLDRLINLHQREHDKTVNIKKALLEKMFPKDGEDKPEIRFAGFTDAWEQRKLGDVYSKIRNAFVGTATPYYVKEGHFYLESNNVKDGQINRNTEIFINDEFYERQKDNWLRTGDLVMVQSGHVGHTAIIPPELDNTAAHALIIIANPIQQINPYFLNYQFQTRQSRKKLSNITTGNTIKHILSSEIKKFCMELPCYDEQMHIGHIFINLDRLIALHKRELTKLQNIKKALLEKMFV